MRLTKLKIENFRNYESFSLNFDKQKHITYIIGPNAHGKTNILEAIYLLALTKSFRTNVINDMIKWGTDYGRITGTFDMSNTTADSNTDTLDELKVSATDSKKEYTIELQAFIGNPPNPRKALKKNGVKISAVNFIGNIQIVFFHPEDLNILYLGPDLRRKYLDILNIQIKPHYYAALRAYKRIMTQRNSLLKSIKDGHAKSHDLDIWDEQLAEQGSIIIYERESSIAFINERITRTYQNISKGEERVQALYKSIFKDGINNTHEDGGAPQDLVKNPPDPKTPQQIAETLLKILQTNRQRDLRAEFTTSGPHRDDIEFILNRLPLVKHASRGEYRSLLMALKLVELSFYEEKSKQKPILLLDDVFSELDPDRQKTLIEGIKGYQTILTSTDFASQIDLNNQPARVADPAVALAHASINQAEKPKIPPEIMTKYGKNVIILHDGVREP